MKCHLMLNPISQEYEVWAVSESEARKEFSVILSSRELIPGDFVEEIFYDEFGQECSVTMQQFTTRRL